MDSIESAIRGALARGDARDRAFRERVYRSVFAALERKLAEAPSLSAEDAQSRREALKGRIVAIEREFVPPPAAPAPPEEPVPVAREAAPAVDNPVRAPAAEPHAPSIDAPHHGAEAAGAAPPVEIAAASGRHDPSVVAEAEELFLHERRHAPSADMSLPGTAGDLSDSEAEELLDERRRRPFAVLLVAVTIVAVLAIGGWWAVSTGMFDSDDGSVPNPPLTLDDDDYTPDMPPLGAGDGAELDWVTVFSPADASAVTAGAGASVETLEEEGQPFLRLRSGNAGATVTFSISRAALAAVAGGPAVFDIVARAQEGRETQISVSCNFRELGDCGRRRYMVGLHRSDFLFEVELPDGQPGADGAISIVTDVDGGGRAMDLFEIRLAPAE